MNTETVTLRMTAREADSVAYVLMTSLRTVGMLDRERADAASAANVLFRQLGYRAGTTERGNRLEFHKDTEAGDK